MAFASVQGEVTRVFFEGKGAEVTEKFTIKGKDISKRWTAWFDAPHGLEVGSQVEVSGLHSDEVDEWTDKEQQTRHSVKRSLNKAKVKGAPAAAPVDEWAATPAYPTAVPF